MNVEDLHVNGACVEKLLRQPGRSVISSQVLYNWSPIHSECYTSEVLSNQIVKHLEHHPDHQ